MTATLTAAQILQLPRLNPLTMGQSRAVAQPAVEVVDRYQMVVTPTGLNEWAVDLYDAATAQLLATETGLPRWTSVEATLEIMPVRDRHQRAGLCEWDLDCTDPCVEPVVPGSDCCMEHDHAFVMRSFARREYSVTCRCGEVFAGETSQDAFGLHARHSLAEVPLS